MRAAERRDVAAIARLLDQLGYPASVDAAARRLERLSESDADTLFVAVVGGEVAGLAALQIGLALEYDAPVAKLSALVSRTSGEDAASAPRSRAPSRRRRAAGVAVFCT